MKKDSRKLVEQRSSNDSASYAVREQLGGRRICLYREGEAPAEPKPSSAGASLSQMKTWQVDFNLQLASSHGFRQLQAGE